MVEHDFIAYISYTFFIHSSVSGHSDCFHILAIVNSAAVNIWVHVSFQIMFLYSSDNYPKVEELNFPEAAFNWILVFNPFSHSVS